MKYALATLVVLAGVVASLGAQNAATPDYSQEAYIVESSRLAYRFETDGTGRRELQARIKVQTDGAVQEWGQLVFGYNASTERLEIEHVRVHKMDGSVVHAPPAAVQELSSPIERDAPIYTDFRQKHVTVPSLRPGETLEFSVRVEMHTALAAGHFWTEHDFQTDAVVLDERLEIDVPASRTVTLLTASGREPAVAEENGRRVYRWTAAQKEPTRSALRDAAADAEEEEELEPSHVRLTTFRNWEEVASWYAGIEKDARALTPELRATAQELVAGRQTDLAKLEALYDFVALNFRYVSISLGAGRYQPRAAAEVLRDQYGDCKDKHTLLASLLESVGLRASTVLIGSVTELDPAFPSPSQFDHVITRVEIENEPVWMDVTTEIAPFRLLSPDLRKKQALVVADGRGRLEETPADPPFPSEQIWSVEGRLGELGTLTARVAYRVRGDLELAFRTVFRAVPSARWKDVLVEMNEGSGIGGEVGEWKISDPAATKEAFTIEYEVTKVSFVDWTKKTASMRLPFSTMSLPELAGGGTTIELGAPETILYRLRLELGEGYTARPPVPVSVTRDYGDYRATYEMNGRTFKAERRLTTRARELPGERQSDYAAFHRVVSGDTNQVLGLDVPAAAAGSAAPGLKTDDLLRSAIEALRGGNTIQAIPILKRIVEAEPKHASAWALLGSAYATSGDVPAAVDALNRQVEINPFDERAYSALGIAYVTQRRYPEAEAAFKKQLEVNPLDPLTPQLLGQLYMDTNRWEEAIPHLERAALRDNDNPSAHVDRGRAYLNVDRTTDALAAFDKAIELSPTPTIWNNVAYYLAQKGTTLDRAQQYAESAVTSLSAETRTFNLSRFTTREVRVLTALGSYWDTLGWVAFARGDLTRAERFLASAWRLTESGVTGDHLGQVYERQGRRQQAIRTYAAALSAARPDPGTRGRLARLASGEDIDNLAAMHRGDLTGMRTVAVPGLKASGTAEFVVLLGAQGVEEVSFAGGDDALKGAADALRRADFTPLLPPDDAVAAKLLRTGVLSCSADVTCSFVLMRVQDVRP